MLNYLGANPQPGLSMPAGMPGSGAPTDPTLPPSAGMGAPEAAPAPPTPAPPAPGGGGGGGGMGQMASMMGGLMGLGMVDPAGRQYMAVTQEDGSVLLHLKNPDGSKGPAVKIIPPIKARKPGA